MKRRPMQDTVEDVEWIKGTASREELAKRPGYSDWQNLERILYRAGRADLVQAIKRLP